MKRRFEILSIVKLVLRFFTSGQRKRLTLYSAVQVLLSFLDLIAIGAIGLLASLAISGVSSKPKGTKVSEILDFLGIPDYSLQRQVATLACIATLILVSKTLISIKISKSTLMFIAETNTSVTRDILTKIFLDNNFQKSGKTLQELLYMTTQGVQVLTLGVLGSLVGMVGDCGLLVLIFGTLMFVNYQIAFLTLLGLAFVALILNKSMHKRAEDFGSESAKLYIESANKFEEFANNYKEIFVRNRRKYVIDQLVSLRAESSNVNAKLMMLPNISKYIVETTIVVGSLLIAGVQFLLSDAINAIATLSLFMASGARIAPALLRIQQGILQIRTNVASASETIEVLQNVSSLPKSHQGNIESDFTQDHGGFTPSISFANVSFRHSENDEFKIDDVSFNVKEGEMIALVGRSGSGKSTIIDLLLGVLPPLAGEIQISNQSPLNAFENWPGAVAYVPQQIYISAGTIFENVVLGYEDQKIDENMVLEVLQNCDLETLYFQNLARKEHEPTKLSGGQQQRIGIARALLTKPRLLVLDEATSALDAMTENSVNLILQKLRGENTLVVVAHRLSTIRNADRVIYIEEGKILASGTFEEVRSQIVDFDTQAKLLGIF